MARAAAPLPSPASASASARAARPQMRRAQTKTMKVALIPKPITVVTRFNPDPSISPRLGFLHPYTPLAHRATQTKNHARAAGGSTGPWLIRLLEQDDAAAAYKCGGAAAAAAGVGLGGGGHRRGVWDLGFAWGAGKE
uniref:Uncharacterized protein n=1 Tax=Leersia perrieri TaxID=77586 RepID=A0A0D9VJG5_9ORYZ